MTQEDSCDQLPICPYCAADAQSAVFDIGLIDDDEAEVSCDRCGKYFGVKASAVYFYSTWKLDP